MSLCPGVICCASSAGRHLLAAALTLPAIRTRAAEAKTLRMGCQKGEPTQMAANRTKTWKSGLPRWAGTSSGSNSNSGHRCWRRCESVASIWALSAIRRRSSPRPPTSIFCMSPRCDPAAARFPDPDAGRSEGEKAGVRPRFVRADLRDPGVGEGSPAIHRRRDRDPRAGRCSAEPSRASSIWSLRD